MSIRIICFVALFATSLFVSFSVGQDLNAYMQDQVNQTEAMLQQQYAIWNQRDQQMYQMQNQFVQQNVNDPAVQQMYQQYINQGMPYGQMTLEQFAYMYAATGGFSREGIANYNQTTRDINARDSAAVRQYQDYVNNLWSATNAYRADVFNRQQRDVGDLMTGSTNYVNPYTGETCYLPYAAQAGQTFTDSYGRTFYVDIHGNYQLVDQNGYYNQLNQVWNR